MKQFITHFMKFFVAFIAYGIFCNLTGYSRHTWQNPVPLDQLPYKLLTFELPIGLGVGIIYALVQTKRNR